MTTRHILSNVMRPLVAAVCLLFSSSCGSELLRTGRAPVMLIIETLAAASGSEPGQFRTPLLSDVATIVEDVSTTFNDLGRAQIRVELKDQSQDVVRDPLNPVTAPSPTVMNAVTITRYRVNYRRADGRNTPGVDVPFGFDGAATITIPPGDSADVVFDLVRHSSKSEPPLRQLTGGGGVRFINTVAEVTFFGRDQNGNEVMVTGMVDVIFGDFADE
jgi:hypothetical protein